MQPATQAQRWMTTGLVFAAVLALPWSVWAAEPSIWYRTGEGCPDGASFLERLERRGIRGRLAAVGDHVDFVVTLGGSRERSSGRLERQTSSGTIAIREVQAASCDAVADALALSLALTVEPESDVPPPAPTLVEAPPSAAGSGEPEPGRPTAKAVQPALPAAERGVPATSAHDEAGGVLLGATLGAADLFEGPWLFLAGPFAEVEASSGFVLPRAALRITLLGGLRRDADANASLWLAAARVEGCALTVGEGAFSLRPCVGGEAGAIGASAHGMNDRAAWSAVVAHARFAYDGGRVGVEAQAGGIVPLTHYQVTAAGARAVLEKTSGIGFSAAVGLSVRLE